jgi:dihydropteroate synthase
MLAGISRKSMIWNTLGIEPTDALNGTTALNMMSLMNGASILRVHDVKPAIECIKLYLQTITHEN